MNLFLKSLIQNLYWIEIRKTYDFSSFVRIKMVENMGATLGSTHVIEHEIIVKSLESIKEQYYIRKFYLLTEDNQNN